MKQEDFWMGDADFFAGMMSKVTDLSKNLYLLVTEAERAYGWICSFSF